VEPCQPGCYAPAPVSGRDLAGGSRSLAPVFRFSLALRLLARIVVLALTVFFAWGLQSGWDRAIASRPWSCPRKDGRAFCQFRYE
jgi:hypothetical protein